jgi:hypothetical protein
MISEDEEDVEGYEEMKSFGGGSDKDEVEEMDMSSYTESDESEDSPSIEKIQDD